MRTLSPAFGLLLAAGCQSMTVDPPVTPDGTPPDCVDASYPAGVVEPMALGETLAPYAWPVALHRGRGEQASLDLADVPCNTDDDIDWSPFDVLLFVSIPAW